MLDFNRKIKQRSLFPLSAKVSIFCHRAVGSESDCIFRDREFDSGLARISTFVEIDHGIISTAPAIIQFRATIGPLAKRDSDGVMLGADSCPILRAYWDILLLQLNQKSTCK